jgi:hypothetical protein
MSARASVGQTVFAPDIVMYGRMLRKNRIFSGQDRVA